VSGHRLQSCRQGSKDLALAAGVFAVIAVNGKTQRLKPITYCYTQLAIHNECGNFTVQGESNPVYNDDGTVKGHESRCVAKDVCRAAFPFLGRG
jgi:hypothetical protein